MQRRATLRWRKSCGRRAKGTAGLRAGSWNDRDGVALATVTVADMASEIIEYDAVRDRFEAPSLSVRG